MRLIITGGHLTPALAVIEKLQLLFLEKKVDLEIYWVGRKYAYEGENTLSVEYRTIQEKKIPFWELSTGKLSRTLNWYFFINLLKIPVGFLQSIRIIEAIKPDLLLSFGGYLALPVCIAAKLKHIPLISHEQALLPGLANIIIAKIADYVCYSWPDTKIQLPEDKKSLTGNPVRQAISNFSQPPNLNIPEKKKVIFLTGGNLGSHILNNFLKEVLSQLLRKYYLIHQVGESQKFDDFNSLLKLRQNLSEEFQQQYFITKYVNEKDLGWILNRADLVIGRAGANIVTELLALNKQAILVPLPWAGQNEQMENARFLKNLGLIEIIPQEKFTPEILLTTITQMINKPHSVGFSVLTYYRNLINNAALKISEIIYEIYLKKKTKKF